jgi:hypothetical protein
MVNLQMKFIKFSTNFINYVIQLLFMGGPPVQQNLYPDAASVFTPTAPIDEVSLFTGRIEQVRSVIRAVNQKGQHAILYGERGVGKTSLANVLHTFLQNQDRILSPRVGCDGMDTFESLWKKVLDEIWMHRKMRPAGFGPEQENSYSSAELIEGAVTPDSVRRALTIISQGALPILIIDEFDCLDRKVKHGIADTIKALSDHAVNATVVLVGVADSVGELIEEHESVERALVQVHVPRMSRAEIQQLIVGGLAKLGLVIESDALSKLCTLVQGLPHYAHLLGLEAANHALDLKVGSISRDLLDGAIAAGLIACQESIKRTWYTATSSHRKDSLAGDVLVACALARTDQLGFFAAQDVRAPLSAILNRKMEIANYTHHLKDFCEDRRGQVLTRVGESHHVRSRFRNPLVQPYVVMQGFVTGRITDQILDQL